MINTTTIKIEKLTSNEVYDRLLFDGNLDKAGFALIKEDLDNFTETFSKKFLVFDFAKLNFINSESIGFLLTIYSRLLKKGATFVVVNSPNNVKDVLEVIGVFKIIKYFDSIESMEKAIKE